MDRIELTAVIGTFLIIASSLAGPETEAIRLTLDQQMSQITGMIHELAGHSKSIFIESLTVIKQSVNLALDLAKSIL